MNKLTLLHINMIVVCIVALILLVKVNLDTIRTKKQLGKLVNSLDCGENDENNS